MEALNHYWFIKRIFIESSLATDSPVLSFNKSRQMNVNYNRRLVGLVREVSALSLMGHKIHPSIIKTAKLAQKFMRQAKALEEVRHFVFLIPLQKISLFLISNKSFIAFFWCILLAILSRPFAIHSINVFAFDCLNGSSLKIMSA